MKNNDIRFYDFDFNLLYILPQNSKNNGYISINTQIQLNDSGSLEITFRDEKLKPIIKNNRDNIIVIWNEFQGYITSYMFTETTYKLFGKHLNGLLNRNVTKSLSYPKNTKVGYLIKYGVLKDVSWITMDDDLQNQGNTITYESDNYMQTDKVLQEVCESGKCGYFISADVANKKFNFELIERKENSLMLSVGNLNIYNPEITYENTELAFGGWYKKKTDTTETWTYITLDITKTGIYKIDSVLDADNENDAKKELQKLKAEYNISVKTKTLNYKEDYNLGDIIRVQFDNITEKRLINGISLWNEQSYGEEPIMIEYEE